MRLDPLYRSSRSFGRRTYDWMLKSPAGLAGLALTVGVGAGTGAVLFRYLIQLFTIFFTGHSDYGGADHEPNPFVPWMGLWFVVVAPVLGGLLYGPLVAYRARLEQGVRLREQRGPG